MAQLETVIAYLDELLEITDFQDYGPNGLQVPGSSELSVVVTGVSAHRDLFERAAARGRAAGGRPPRALLGLPPALDHAGDEGAAACPVRQRHRARGLPPAARRPSRGGEQRADLRGARAGAGRAVRRAPRPPRRLRRPLGRGHPVRGAPAPLRRDVRPGAVHVGHRARRSSTASGSSRAPPPRASARRSRAGSTRSSPASRPSTSWRTRARAARTSSRPATTPPRRFGVRRLGELVAERFGVEHRFVDAPNPI